MAAAVDALAVEDQVADDPLFERMRTPPSTCAGRVLRLLAFGQELG